MHLFALFVAALLASCFSPGCFALDDRVNPKEPSADPKAADPKSTAGATAADAEIRKSAQAVLAKSGPVAADPAKLLHAAATSADLAASTKNASAAVHHAHAASEAAAAAADLLENGASSKTLPLTTTLAADQLTTTKPILPSHPVVKRSVPLPDPVAADFTPDEPSADERPEPPSADEKVPPPASDFSGVKTNVKRVALPLPDFIISTTTGKPAADENPQHPPAAADLTPDEPTADETPEPSSADEKLAPPAADGRVSFGRGVPDEFPQRLPNSPRFSRPLETPEDADWRQIGQGIAQVAHSAVPILGAKWQPIAKLTLSRLGADELPKGAPRPTKLELEANQAALPLTKHEQDRVESIFRGVSSVLVPGLEPALKFAVKPAIEAFGRRPALVEETRFPQHFPAFRHLPDFVQSGDVNSKGFAAHEFDPISADEEFGFPVSGGIERWFCKGTGCTRCIGRECPRSANLFFRSREECLFRCGLKGVRPESDPIAADPTEADPTGADPIAADPTEADPTIGAAADFYRKPSFYSAPIIFGGSGGFVPRSFFSKGFFPFGGFSKGIFSKGSYYPFARARVLRNVKPAVEQPDWTTSTTTPSTTTGHHL